MCLSAPGGNLADHEIYSTVSLGTGTGPYDGYGDKSGTSMASPVVAGVAPW